MTLPRCTSPFCRSKGGNSNYYAAMGADWAVQKLKSTITKLKSSKPPDDAGVVGEFSMMFGILIGQCNT